jgi:hypothetical protein
VDDLLSRPAQVGNEERLLPAFIATTAACVWTWCETALEVAGHLGRT